MKKVIKLTESDLTNIVKRVIKEQKKFDLMIAPGSNAQAQLSGNILTIMTEDGAKQKLQVKTSLPEGRFMFQYGKDGKYYGFDNNNKKYEIFLQGKL
jgi:hypothetical protein